jgi:ComF family protein
MWRHLLRSLLDLVWPPRSRCLLCAGPLAETGSLVCTTCLADMRFDPDEPRCANCSRPTFRSDRICPECQDGSPYGVVFALGPHRGALREAVHHFKFGDRPDLAPLLGARLAAAIAVPFDCVVPVPLHRARLRERGYNQAALLADTLAGVLHVPLYQSLIRSRDTGHQAKLDREHRLYNLAGAFAVAVGQPVPWAGGRVLLVDDVLTTGATASAAAEALYQTGARSVDLAVLAVSTTPVRTNQKTRLNVLHGTLDNEGERIRLPR